MITVYVILGLIGFFAVAYLLVGIVIAAVNLYHVPKDADAAIKREYEAGVPEEYILYPFSEKAEIVSDLGAFKLSAKVFFAKGGSDKWVIGLHGYDSLNTTMHKYAKMFNDFGYNFFAPDSRFCGESEGKCFTFGDKEHKDVCQWIDYVREHYKPSSLGLFGVSMGAATAVLTASVRKDVGFLISYCSYSSYRDIITARGTAVMGNFFKFLYPSVRFGSFLVTGMRPSKINTVEAIKRVRCPILVLHSKKDDFTPYVQSVALAQANPAVRLYLFEKGTHSRAFAADPAEYKKVVGGFLDGISLMA